MQSHSKEKLIDYGRDSTTASSTDLTEHGNAETTNIQIEQNSFMLNKFIGNSIKNLDEINSIKQPIPKPRRRKPKSTHSSSKGTFNITSPNIVIDNKTKDDDSSVKTYEVVSPKQVTRKNHEDKIGDILIHDVGEAAKVSVPNSRRSISLRSEVRSLTSKKDVASSDSEDAYNKNKIDNNESIEMKNLKKDIVEITNEVKPKPRKRHMKKKHVSSDQEKDIDEISKADENNDERTAYSYEKITEIIIHRTDRLQLNSLVIHPLVKLHVVDINTGRYFVKSDKNRSVVFYYETSDCDYISPVMTQPYNLQENRSIYPKWEEPILLNEDFNYIVKESSNIIIFFELIDFLPFSVVNTNSLKNGWQKIAFAFLKLCGPNGELNLHKKLQLQLYYPDPGRKKCEPHQCSIWYLWKKKKMIKYPSTLYVTIKEVISPKVVVEALRSKTPIQSEKGSTNLLIDGVITGQNLKNSARNASTADLKSSKKIERITNNSQHDMNETCKLPNKCLGKIPTCDEGCFIFKFSNAGEYLACSFFLEDVFTAVVYSCETLEEVQKFPCHRCLIYDIDWSMDDTILILASADNTVSVWNFKSYKFIQILPHPSFVYASKLDQEYAIATGCYDKIIRIWVPSDSANFTLSQELERHNGYVTTLAFNRKSNLLFSADSIGNIIEWIKEDDNWKFNRDITIVDLKCTIINQILLFTKERRLLVHARDSTLRIIDLKNACVLHWLQGSLNRRVHTFCSLSPCKTFVIGGSENGIVNIWDSKSGNQIASYLPYTEDYSSIHCVQFHPKDNVIAMSHYGSDVPILLYHYDKNVVENDVGLRIIDEEFLRTSRRIKTTSSKQSLDLNALKEVKTFDLKGILDRMDELIISQKSGSIKNNE